MIRGKRRIDLRRGYSSLLTRIDCTDRPFSAAISNFLRIPSLSQSQQVTSTC